ncbi:DUF1450 domain-containing protein [Paenibacillus sp. SGZ-1009]|uniref:DUF1450 domain-containing protein n=1 Tax=Paenibacillus campi TaxID=3106031 RepID=UPI002AFF09D5|nr:DUF1450 domain-containing protein [Paenibacillus sp. SGZ-1009]
MTIIKYCSKNDKQGTKQMYEQLKQQFPELTQQRKGCLGECKLCRRQPFVLIDKKQIVRAKSPDQLIGQLRTRLASTATLPDDVRTVNKPAKTKAKKADNDPSADTVIYHFGGDGKKELYLSFNSAAAQLMIERLQALQQSGKRQKIKAMRSKKSGTIDARIVITHTETATSQLDTAKKRLFLELTSADLAEVCSRLQHYVQTGVLNSEPRTCMRSGGKKAVQVYLTALEAPPAATAAQESIA